ncbi:MAG: hypothetical protein JXA89_16040 [Anaerolineae bacterium]|nr:hypothetical protein [Anaerolineae bacterium]
MLFIKPEIFTIEKQERIDQAIDLVFEKLQEFGVYAGGVAIINGRVLEQLEIMNRHYGFINQLSRQASSILGADDRQRIAAALGIESIDQYIILGGHEYLAQYPDENDLDLDELWFTKKSVKLRSGFYIQSYDKNGQNLILVNGFHPLQLSHYTNPKHRIVVILLHSNTDWAILRNQMIGATFPEKAVPQSIRGTLYAQPEKFGLDSVSIANNGVHLSAGPFEALFEIVNFGRALDLDPREQKPLILQKMLEAGSSIEKALGTLDNPILKIEPKAIDLYTATEDINTAQAVALWKENCADAISV